MPSSGAVEGKIPAIWNVNDQMYTGTLIHDLLDTVDRVRHGIELRQRDDAKSSSREVAAENVGGLSNTVSEPEQFPQSFRLGPADGDFGLFLVVHAQLVGTFEPRNNFANAVDIHEVGAVSAPEEIGI